MECIVRGVPLFYEVYGTGTPIILLHGFSCDHRQMKGCLEPLFAQLQGWQRLYLDLPGMGQTPGKESLKSTDDMLDVVVNFIDVVIPGQPFLLVGESYGGYLSQGVVHHKFEQVAGMALICSGVIMERSRRDLPPRTVMLEDPVLLAQLDPADAEEFTSMAVVQDQYHWERFRDEILKGAKIADEAFLQEISQRYSCSFDVGKLPHPFPRPVVFLTGRQDHVAGYRDAWRILENYPHATFAVLDRAGHNLPIEQPQLFNALIGEWLDRVRETMQSYSFS
ncbi:alpha/beta fold hydrolase [Ktedonobacter robiniae]|uniref:2-hydroxy-6-oxo-6-phenylhexa-2,4-dienoate hydrolase n=1 Tax=Ktedonobacter robiniae TaxID=2778365 RepID=A0ABQ3UYR9_9CHLR|nr:alpha/beta hydrolase [Ktedonobacter robiniae]GHO57802.1 2-hydroxy-6-oxo-6-phenylhexa-2,4-dienoate hydrolase [Ktedonobacter robiniae]